MQSYIGFARRLKYLCALVVAGVETGDFMRVDANVEKRKSGCGSTKPSVLFSLFFSLLCTQLKKKTDKM